MKKVALISIFLTMAFVSDSQQTTPMQPAAPAQNPPTVNSGAVPPNGAVPPQNVMIPNAAPQTPTNPPNTSNPAVVGTANPTDTNQFNPTNQLGVQSTNNLETNTSPALAAALAMTNRLSVMAHPQVQNVINVQVGLNVLAQIAVNLGGVQNVQQSIQQNPQAQQQIQLVSGQIIDLARGTAKPSEDSVERLSLDLLRACRRAHLRRDHQLVLAIIINDACNSEKLSAPQFSQAVNEGLMVLRTDGVAPAYCNSIGCDLNSMALEVQPNLGI